MLAAEERQTTAALIRALGIAVLGALGTAVYRGQLGAAVSPSVPMDTTIVAQGALGGAMALAGLLPDGSGRELLIAAQHAFTRAFEVSAAVSAALAMATAVMAIVLLRHVSRNDSRRSSCRRRRGCRSGARNPSPSGRR
jgi:DHA2 family multidrug resistance protein-like MFS transporter